MIVIYDLDKTSLFCPIANFLDKFIPHNIILKQIYYKLYPFVHILEMKFGLLKINEKIYNRAVAYKAAYPNCLQVVITARHRSISTDMHIKKVFRDIDVSCFCVAQGITNLSKSDIARLIPKSKDEEIVMYDDNLDEMLKMRNVYKGHFTGIRVNFKDKEEILQYVC